MKGSVFDELLSRRFLSRGTGNIFGFDIYEREPMYFGMFVSNVYLDRQRIGMFYDYGDLIAREFDIRGGRINNRERFAGWQFMVEDYNFSMVNAEKCFDISQRMFRRLFGRSSVPIYYAWNLIRRAREDITRASIIYPQGNLNGMSYEEGWKDVDYFRDKLYFASEFPKKYKEILPIHYELREAVEREDYEIAKLLKVEIDDLVREK